MADNEDVKVVELRFDNKRFEKNVRKSRKTIKELQKDLDHLEGKDLEINTTQSEKNIKKFGSAIDEIKLKFSSLQVIGVAAISRITNEVIDSAESIISSMSAINSIAQGYESYTSQLTSMRTLLNIYGTEKFGFMGMEELEKELGRLRWYSDETSYGFELLTRTISSFGVANIGASDAISALMGFGNLAAGGGLSISQASELFDNVSRAIASGHLTAIDYSGIQRSGIITDEFLDTLKEVAVEYGTVRKAADGTYKTIRDKEKKITGGKKITNQDLNLTAGWVTSEVFTETLKRYSEYADQVYDLMVSEGIDQTSEAMEMLDQQIVETGGRLDSLSRKTFISGQEAKNLADAIGSVKIALSSSWSKIFKKVLGDVEESSTFWTEVSDKLYNIFVSGQEARYESVEGWYELGGREKLIESIYNLLDGIKQRLDIFKEGFSDIIPKVTTDNLIKFTDKFNELSEKFLLNEERVNRLNKAYKNIVSIFVSLKNIILTFLKTIRKSITGDKNDVTFIDIFISIIEGLGKIIKAISSILSSEKVIDFIVFIAEKIGNAIRWIISIFYNKSDNKKEKDNELNGIAEDIENSEKRLEKDISVLESIGSFLSGFFSFLKNVVTSIFSLLGDVGIKLKDWGSKLVSGEMSFGKALLNISALVIGIKSIITRLSILDSIKSFTETFSSISDAFWSIYNKNLWDAIKNIATSLLMLSAAILIIAGIPWKKLLLASGVIIGSLVMIALMVRFITSGIPTSDVGDGISGFIKGIIKSTVTSSSRAIELDSIGKLLTSIGISLLLIAIALAKISKIGDDIWIGIIGFVIIIGLLTTAIKILQTDSRTFLKGSLMLISYGIAVKSIAKAIETIAKIGNFWDTVVGILAVSGIIVVLTASFIILEKMTETIKIGRIFMANILIQTFTITLTIIALLVKMLSKIPPLKLLKGWISLNAILLSMVAILPILSILGSNFEIPFGFIIKTITILYSLVPPIAALTLLVIGLSLFKGLKLLKGFGVLGLIILSVFGVIKLLALFSFGEGFSFFKMLGVILEFTMLLVPIFALSFLIIDLGSIGILKLLKGFATIWAIVISMFTMMRIITLFSFGEGFSFFKMLGVILEFTMLLVPIIILALVFKSLSKIPTKNTNNAIKSLKMIIGAIAVMTTLFLVVGSIPYSIPVLFTMVAIIAAMTGAIYLFAMSMKKISGMQMNVSGLVEQMSKMLGLLGLISLSSIAILTLSPAMISTFTTILAMDLAISTTAGSIELLALALNELAKTLSKFGVIKPPELDKMLAGLEGVGTNKDPYKMHIQFIVDDSEIRNALDRTYVVNVVMGTAQTVSAEASGQYYERAMYDRIMAMMEANVAGPVAPPSIENNFYITNDDPEQVANEVSRIIMNDYEREGGLIWQREVR